MSKNAYKKNLGFFLKNPAVWDFLYFGPLTPCKVSEKSLVNSEINTGISSTDVENSPPHHVNVSLDVCAFLDMRSLVNIHRHFSHFGLKVKKSRF